MFNSKQVLDQLELFIRAVVRDAVRDEIPAQLPPMPTPPTNRVGGIQLAIAVTGLAKQTIYNMVSKRVIPHSVQSASGRLIFEEQTLREWMVQNRRATKDEVIAEEFQAVIRQAKRKGGRRDRR